jgi:uncharacterized protein YlxP (DUF503 family)
MFVGVCRLTLYLHGNASLKGKRKIMRSLIERTRTKFNASVAEVGDNDAHKRGVVGISVVGNDAAHVDAMLANITRFVEQLGLAPVADIETEVIPLGGEIGTMEGMPHRCPEMGATGEGRTSGEDEEW